MNKQKKIGVILLAGLMLLFSAIFVSAALFSSSGEEITAQQENVQYTQPSPFELYAGTNVPISEIWPSLGTENCYARSDLMIEIAPLGCTPTVVRSDLLEEQNVPVFCMLRGTKINPLIEVPNINSISVKGQVPQSIAGIGFHPARAALDSGSTVGNSPSMDNLGYVVVVLRKQINESSMPDWVEANLTAQIAYDTQNTYGAGTSSFILKTLNDVDWKSKFAEYSFWSGKGYVRLEDIQQSGDTDTAKISIYRDKENKIGTFMLRQGQMSPDIYLSGYYCSAGLNVRVDKIDLPVKRAKLNIAGNTQWVVEGSTIFNNKCTVEKIEQPSFNSGFIRINCYGDVYELAYNPPKAKIIVKDMLNGEKEIKTGFDDYSVKQKIYSSIYMMYAGNAGDEQYVVLVNSDHSAITDDAVVGLLNKKISALLSSGMTDLDQKEKEIKTYLESLLGGEIKTGTKDSKDNNVVKILSKTRAASFSLKEGSADNISGFVFTGFKGPEDRIYPADEEDRIGRLLLSYYNLAQDAYKAAYNTYPAEKEANSQDSYGAIALWKAAQLAKSVEKFQTYQNYLEDMLQKFPDSSYAKNAGEELATLKSDVDYSKASVIASGPYGTFPISLNTVEQPAQDEANVDLLVNGERKILAVSDSVDKTERITIDSMTNDNVVFSYSYLNDEGEIVSGQQFSLKEKETRTLQLNVKSEEKTVILVSKINLKKIAYVSIVPKSNNGYQETNFTFKIAIEKRAIKLSPQKTKEMIDSLNKSIVQWEKISKTLGNTVQVMKGACFATSMVLWTKNLFANMKGGNQARTEVMKQWKAYCAENIGYGKEFQTSHECYLKNSATIDSDTAAVDSAMKISDACIAKIQASAKLIATNEKLGSEEAYVRAASQEACFQYSFQLTKENKNPIDVASVLAKFPGLEKQGIVFTSDVDTAVQYLELVKACNQGRLSEKFFCINQKSQTYDFLSKFDSAVVVEKVSADFSQKTGLPSPVTYAVGGLNPDKLLVQRSNVAIGDKLSAGDYFAYYNLEGVGLVLFRLNQIGIEGNQYQLEKAFKVEKDSIGAEIIEDNLPANRIFNGFDVGKCQNTLKDADLKVKFFETAPYQGLPALVPIDERGWYVKVQPARTIGTQSTEKYDASGLLKSFYICNAGENGRIDWLDGDSGDDGICCRLYQEGQGAVEGTVLPGLSEQETTNLINKAKNCVRSAADQYGKKTIYSDCLKKELKADIQPLLPEQECEDTMSPQDCSILFNVCDPVICPSSRCNLGGRYYVEDVIQTGIIGGLTLCAPNAREGIAIPVCLSGINAGLENYISILKASRDCLQENFNTGRNVGICDEIKSVYVCELFWREGSLFFSEVIPRMLNGVSKATGGGGEYIDVLNAWQKTLSSITYFKDFYAKNALKSFKTKTLAEVGTDVCRAFVSKKFDVSKIFDTLTEPESPVQFTSYFDEIPMTTATVPATSQYKVYYHIYAGKEQGSYYSVYLRTKPESSFYITLPTVQVASGFVSMGNFVDEAKDFTAPSGYQEVCIRINTQEKCGFGKVSTDYGLNALTEKYLAEQAKQTITTEEQCISGTPSVSALAANPLNIQSGVEQALQPELYKQGITRVCSGDNPSSNVNPARWTPVGYCDSAKKIRCWLDTDSVKTAIKDLQLEDEVLIEAEKKLGNIGIPGAWTEQDSKTKLLEAEADASIALLELFSKLGTKTTTTVTELPLMSASLFAFDSAVLTDSGKNVITSKLGAQISNLKSSSTIKIQGYASKEGEEQHNQELSQARADAVASFIIEKYGSTLESRQIRVEPPVGMGETSVFSEKKSGKAAVENELQKIENAGSFAAGQQIASSPTSILAEDRRVVVSFTTSNINIKTETDAAEFDRVIRVEINSVLLQYQEVIKNSYLNSYKARAWIGIGDLYAGVTMLLHKFAPYPEAKIPIIPVAAEIAVKLPSGLAITETPKDVTADATAGKPEYSVFSNDNLYWVVFAEVQTTSSARFNVWKTTKREYADNYITKNDQSKMVHEITGKVISNSQEFTTPTGLKIKLKSVNDKTKQVTYSVSFTEVTVSVDAQNLAKLMQDADKAAVSGRNCNCGTYCTDYAGWIIKYAKQYSPANSAMDPLLVLALMMQESSCNKNAGNSLGYAGLMQIKASDYPNWNNPEFNIKTGIRILRSKYDTFGSKTTKFSGACTADYRQKSYTGWQAAIRGYNGWGCSSKYPSQDYFVDEVWQRYQKLKTDLPTAVGTTTTETPATEIPITPAASSEKISFEQLGAEYKFIQGKVRYLAEKTGSYEAGKQGNYWSVSFYDFHYYVVYYKFEAKICYAKTPADLLRGTAGKIFCWNSEKEGSAGSKSIAGIKVYDAKRTSLVGFSEVNAKIIRDTSTPLPKL